MSWRGIAAGVFGLIVLQVLVANPRAYGALGGLTSGLAKGVHWFLDPNTPAIPDRSKPKTDAATSPTTTAPAATPTATPKPFAAGSVPGHLLA